MGKLPLRMSGALFRMLFLSPNKLRIYDACHSPANRRIERGEEEEEEALARSPALNAELMPPLKICIKVQIF